MKKNLGHFLCTQGPWTITIFSWYGRPCCCCQGCVDSLRNLRWSASDLRVAMSRAAGTCRGNDAVDCFDCLLFHRRAYVGHVTSLKWSHTSAPRPASVTLVCSKTVGVGRLWLWLSTAVLARWRQTMTIDCQILSTRVSSSCAELISVADTEAESWKLFNC